MSAVKKSGLNKMNWLASKFCSNKYIMKKTLITLLAATLFWQVNAAESIWLTDLPKAEALAKAENNIVLLDFTGSDWCPWCLRFHAMANGAQPIDSLIKADYVYMMANVSQDKKKRDYGLFREFGYPNRFGYPVFVILNGDGKVLHIQDSGVLEHCQVKGYDTAKVVTFLKMWSVKAVDPATYLVK